MKCTLKTDSFAIYDDVLSENHLSELWEFVVEQKFIPVHRNEWAKVWSLAEGAPFVTRTFHSSGSNPSAESQHDGEKVGDPFLNYPTGDSIDELFYSIGQLKSDIAPLVGVEGKDWSRFSAAAYLYPQNAGLSWHVDSVNKTGAYTYYLSEDWGKEWGGELLIASPTTELGGVENYDGQSLGYYIAPRSNRLVVMKAGTRHKINRVAPAAGDRLRYSISGFFNRPSIKPTGLRTEISAVTSLHKWATSYVARMHQHQASLVARHRGSALAGEEYYEVFSFIVEQKQSFCAADLPGSFDMDEKVEIIVSLLEADVLRV